MICTVKIIQPMIAMILAPLVPGVINRTKAKFAGRKGQPLLQLYYDLWRLMNKGAVYSKTTSWVFKAAPVICLAAVMLTTFIVPLGGQESLLNFEGDLILLAYVLGLMRFFIVIGALDTGSSFEGMGASREVHFSALAEPAMLIALAAVARETSDISLSGMFGAITSAFWQQNIAVLALAGAAMVIVLLTENARIPVDDPDTHLELTMIHEVMVLDNSGPDFAFILYGSALKIWIFGALLVGMVVPLASLPWWGAMAAAVGAILVIAVIVGVIESCMARLRLVKVSHLLLGAISLAVLAVVFALKN